VTSRSLFRRREAAHRVSNAELFFDLVYVFAITQLSHHLIGAPTVEGAVQTLILLGVVWEAWAYTMWVTNWLDPDQVPVRVMLFGLALGSLVLSIAIPEAFAGRGWAFAGAYAAMQIGRTIYVIAAVRRDQSLQRNFERILCWCIVSGTLALIGAATDGHTREVLWAIAVGIDVLGGVIGFYVPGWGRSSTAEWTVDGAHIAERCHAFVLIALGESVVVLGATLSELTRIGPSEVVIFGFGFCGVVALWWIYSPTVPRGRPR
jgi:low temperature requirement protein LtrA